MVDFPTMPMLPISASNPPHRFSREAPNGYLATALHKILRELEPHQATAYNHHFVRDGHPQMTQQA